MVVENGRKKRRKEEAAAAVQFGNWRQHEEGLGTITENLLPLGLLADTIPMEFGLIIPEKREEEENNDGSFETPHYVAGAQ